MTLSNKLTPLILTGILALAALVMSPVLANGFTNWDDPDYVLNNPLIRHLTVPNIKAIFTTDLMGKFHPLTILSYAIEYHFFHKHQPLIYHFDNLALHLINILLVFSFIRALTTRHDYALWTALLFAIHPLNVEPVAWISGRKDVLFIFFYLSALICYQRALKSSQSLFWMSAVLTCFVLALLSKLMALSLPLVLLLLDFHARGRITAGDMLKKIPLFVLSLGFALISLISADSAQAFPASAYFGVWDRCALSLQAVYEYIIRILLPHRLSCFHPLIKVSPDFAILAFIFLSGLSFLIWRVRKSEPLIIFGGLFFLITILPVLHLIEVNDSLIYERFAYLPGIGLFLILARGADRALSRLLKALPWSRFFLLGAIIVYISTLAGMSHRRCFVWHNSGTLWQNVIKNYPSAAIAYHNLGAYLSEKGETLNALRLFEQTIDIEPKYTSAYFNKGNMLARAGDFSSALEAYTQAIQLDDQYTDAWVNRASMLLLLGQYAPALADYNRAAQLAPDKLIIYENRGMLFLGQKDYPRARADFLRVLEKDPGNVLVLEKMRLIEKNNPEPRSPAQP